MAVYVDDMMAKFEPTHVPGRTYVMCHMIADTTEELLAMADAIGVSRKWIQHAGTVREHFDIAQSKRARAVRCGARQITMRQLGAMMMLRRTTGVLPSDPDEAVQRVRAMVSESTNTREAQELMAKARA